MKIAYFSSSIIPSRAANGIHVMKMCQALASHGHETFLFCPDRKNEKEKNIANVYDYYNVTKSFKIVMLPWLDIPGKGYIYAFLSVFKAKLLKVDIVFGRNLMGCLVAAFVGFPVIFESHSPVSDSGKPSNWFFEKLIKSKNLKRFVVITDALKNHYLEKYPQLVNTIFVAADGADPFKDNVVPVALPNKGPRLQVGYVGSLYKGRGIDLIAELALLLPMTDFHIVGGQEADIVASKQMFKNHSNVIFHGHQAPSQIESFLSAFDVLLAPYQNKVSVYGGKGDTSQWMSPLKIFEYMGAGKAMIASDLPALKEVLEHNVNALLAPPTDVELWKNHLEHLRDDKEFREKLGNRAKEIFLEKYTWQSRAHAIMRDVNG